MTIDVAYVIVLRSCDHPLALEGLDCTARNEECCGNSSQPVRVLLRDIPVLRVALQQNVSLHLADGWTSNRPVRRAASYLSTVCR